MYQTKLKEMKQQRIKRPVTPIEKKESRISYLHAVKHFGKRKLYKQNDDGNRPLIIQKHHSTQLHEFLMPLPYLCKVIKS